MTNMITKAGPYKEQFDSRVQLGFKRIELQLTTDRLAHEDVAICKRDDIDIIGVHTPLGKKCIYKDISIEKLYFGSEFDIFVSTCEVAEGLAKYYGHDVYVVLHCTARYQDLEGVCALHQLSGMLGAVLKAFPHIVIMIENSSGIGLGRPYTRITSDSISRLCRRLNELTETNRFFQLIDTCHFLMSDRFCDYLKKGGYPYPEESLEDFFRNAKEYGRVMHLCNITGTGLFEGHGTAFSGSEEDKKLLSDIMEMKERYLPEAEIVLEIKDEDYIRCPNLMKTVESLKKLNY